MSIENLVWEQKYRPTKVADVILPEETMKMVQSILASGDIPNFLFSGTGGIGKTTLARAIASELGAELLYINASLDGNIDTLRTTITQFVSSVSMDDSRKIVLLDECLSENEKVRVGTVDNWVAYSLKDLERDKQYPIVSFNMETGEFENDIGYIISDREDELFEVTLEDGSTIISNSKHPFVCVSDDGKIVTKTIQETLEGECVVVG